MDMGTEEVNKTLGSKRHDRVNAPLRRRPSPPHSRQRGYSV